MIEAGITWLIIIFAILLIYGIYSSVMSAKYGDGRKVKVRFVESEHTRALYVGQGQSVGSAMVDGFAKMYYALTPNSHLETIERNLRSMKRSLSENRSRMRENDIACCQSYIDKTQKLFDGKKAAADQVLQQKAAAEQERRQKEKELQAKREQAEKERAQRMAALPEQRRFVAEQRRMMSDSLRYDVMQRDHFRCQICGATQADGVKLHVDHIVPVSKGGKTEMSNLRTLCERCNLGKGDKIEQSDRKANYTSVPTEPVAESIQAAAAPSCLKENYFTIEELIHDAKQIGIEVVDKRSNGGCLWIRSIPENEKAFSLVKVSGKPLTKAKKTRTFGGNPGWFIN